MSKLFEPLSRLKKPSQANFYTGCQVGHAQHDHKIIEVVIPDDTKRAGATKLKMDIYDWQKYFKTEGQNETVPLHEKYCTGQDIISYCLERQGVWEEIETRLIMNILWEPNEGEVVMDFGSHIGYYSLLARDKAFTVAAIDANAENIERMKRSNLHGNLGPGIYSYLGWLDDDVPQLDPAAGSIHLLKADVEGAEQYVIKCVEPLLERRQIKYIVLEISPTFNDSYPALVDKIGKAGYDTYQIPTAGWEHMDEFSVAPLYAVKRYCQLEWESLSGLELYIKKLHQENFLFIRRET